MVKRQRTIIEAISPRVKTSSIDVFYEFCEQITKALGMSLVIPPIIVKFPAEIKDPNTGNIKQSLQNDYGISATLIWAESGMQIHTWAEHDLITVDIFSCKEYDTSKAVEVFEAFFRPVRYERCVDL